MSGAHIAAHAAAEKKRREQEEEELMTGYTPSDLNDPWEFKIVRSYTSQFKNPEVFRSLVQAESVAGWELLEKLDDGRVRFKRPVSARRRDAMLPPGIDPYRTQHGPSEGVIVFWVLAAIFVGTAAVIGTVMAIDAGLIF